MSTRLRNATSIRLEEKTWKKVEATAKRVGLKKTDLIRSAIFTALTRWEKTGVNFSTELEAAK